jgi:predicted alpha/beta-hydrolase family hydrolase
MIADEVGAAGLLCLGYPFHPAGKPERLRIAHLETIRTPSLIVQGSRDRLGSEEEVSTYTLSSAIELAWMEDGDHSFQPRKKSGRTIEQNLEAAAAAALHFIQALG